MNRPAQNKSTSYNHAVGNKAASINIHQVLVTTENQTQKNCFIGQTPRIQSYILTGTKNYTYPTWMNITETLVLEGRCRMVHSLPAVDPSASIKGQKKASLLLSCLLTTQIHGGLKNVWLALHMN